MIASYVKVILSPFLIVGIVYVKELPAAPPVISTVSPVLETATILFGSREMPFPVIVSSSTTFRLVPVDVTVVV